ncbi:MAG TPA: response regulator [Thermoanaerobaculia bacterium]|nr:response regulator [Thermoanaerobaculia bacterium]
MNTTNSGRVLLVDDQPDLVEGFRQLLEVEGFEVTLQTSVITLPLTVRRIDPDVILLDLSLPALSGSALLQHGAHKLLRTKAPIILFSGRGPGELSRMTEELGADGFLSKGDDLNDAIRRIRMWCMNRRALRALREGENDATRTALAAAH